MKLSQEFIFGKENRRSFLVNKRSGDYYELDRNTDIIINNIINNKKNNLKNPIIKKLKKEGILIDEEFGNKDNLHLQWHLTERCNLKCIHCYQDNCREIKELNIAEMKRFFDHFIYVLKKQKMNGSISLTGGEPLILGNKLWEIVDYIKQGDLPIKIYVLTNGTLVTKDVAKKFLKYNISCQISFDGANKNIHDAIRGNGNFEKSLNGAKILIDNRISTSSHFVIMKKNSNFVEEAVKFCVDNRFEMITFSQLVPFGRGKNLENDMLSPAETRDVYNKIFSLKNRYRNQIIVNTNRTLWCNIDKNIGGTCPAGFSTLVINADGSVYPCRRLPISIGNVIENSIFEMWYGSEVMKNLRNRTKINKCGKCPLLDRCGGCRAVAYAHFNDYMAPDPQCWRLYKHLPTKP